MSNQEAYILYILKVNKVRGYKVGITSLDRVETRFKEIEKTFGSINLAESIYFKSNSNKNIKNLEKSLHLLLWNDSKDIQKRTNGSGHTEFFKLNNFNELKKLVNTIKKLNIIQLEGPFKINQKKRFWFNFKYFLIISLLTLTGLTIYYKDLI